MSQRWQYQGKFEPVLVTVSNETVTLDKWQGYRQEPWPRAKPHPPGFTVAPLEPSLTSDVTPLSWWQPTQEPVRQPKRLPILAGAVLAQPGNQLVTIDPLTWFQPTSEPVRQPPRLPRLGGAVSPLEPTLTATPPELSWLYPNQIPILPPPPRWPGVSLWPPAATIPEVVAFDPIKTLLLWASYTDTLTLNAAYEATINLAAQVGAVTEQTIKIVRAQDLTLRFKLSPPKDVTGWALSFTVKEKLGGSTSISKTIGSGVTIANGPKGVIEVAIAKSSTSSLLPNAQLDDGEGYVWDLKRTDSGSNVVLARGELILEEEVTA